MKLCIPVFAVLLSASCSLYSFTDTIILELPDLPSSWRHLPAVESTTIRYLATDRTIREIEVAPGVRSAEIRIPKLSVVSVVAIPRTDETAAVLKPAGAVYPWHLSDSGRLRLEWINGFVSSVLLACDTDRVQAVNVEKLTRAVTERSSGNPWSLDFEVLRNAIDRSMLESRRIIRSPVFDVEYLIRKGRWVSGNPLDTSILEISSPTSITQQLSEGVHSFFNIDSGERVGIAVDRGGWVVVYPNEGVGSTGRW